MCEIISVGMHVVSETLNHGKQRENSMRLDKEIGFKMMPRNCFKSF